MTGPVWDMEAATRQADAYLATVRAEMAARPQTQERGDAGFAMWEGTRQFDDTDDPNAKWLPPDRWQTVAEMLIDPDVCAALDATTLPLLGRDLAVEPGVEKGHERYEVNMEATEFIQNDFVNMSTAWWDVRQAALDGALADGVAPFQTVFSFGDDKKYHLRKLSYRPPSSIGADWHVDEHGGPDGFTQTKADGTTDRFYMDEILGFVRNQTRTGFTGDPLTRRMYGPWLIKTQLSLIGAASVERHGMGIPTVLYRGTTDTAHARIQRVLMSLKSGAKQYMLFTAQDLSSLDDFRILGVEGRTIDPVAQMEYHRRAIYMSTFTQWIPLGTDGVGARALGDSHLDAFMMMLRAIQRMECETYNRYLIPRWVAYNWGDKIPEGELPRVTAPRIDGRDVKSWMEAVMGAVTAGAQIDATALTDAAYEMLDITPPEESPALPPPQSGEEDEPEQPSETKTEEDVEAGARRDELPSVALIEARGVTVDFDAMIAALDTSEQRMAAILGKLQRKQANRLVSISEKIIKGGDPSALEDVEVPYSEESDAMIEELMVLAASGCVEAADELASFGIDVGPGVLPPDQASILSQMADEQGRNMSNRMRAALGVAVLGAIGRPGPVDRDRLRGLIAPPSEKQLLGYGKALASTAQSFGRMATIDKAAKKYAGMFEVVYTTWMDETVCDACAALEGMTWAAEDPARIIPPNPECVGGDRCRCRLVPVPKAGAIEP